MQNRAFFIQKIPGSQRPVSEISGGGMRAGRRVHVVYPPYTIKGSMPL